MNPALYSRRELLASGAGLLASTALPLSAVAAPARERAADEPFGYCLNMSTLRGQQLSVTEQIDVASAAGYDAIEPWMRDLHGYVEQGFAGGPQQADPRPRPDGGERHRVRAMDR